MQAFEAITGLTIVLHDLCGHFRPMIDPHRYWHASSYCRVAKTSPHAGRCYAFEVPRLRPQLETLIRQEGRIHQCHAGLIEWVVVVAANHPQPDPLGILFAGQRRARGWNPEVVEARSGVVPPEAPEVGKETAAHYLELLRQLGARLAVWAQKRTSKASGLTRAQQILTFIEERHTGPVQLRDLANALRISPSRVAHVVNEETGQNWGFLLRQARLRTASYLLQHTQQDVVTVACTSGFGDPSQFSRIFKREKGVTPGRFRRRCRGKGSEDSA